MLEAVLYFRVTLLDVLIWVGKYFWGGYTIRGASLLLVATLGGCIVLVWHGAMYISCGSMGKFYTFFQFNNLIGRNI